MKRSHETSSEDEKEEDTYKKKPKVRHAEVSPEDVVMETSSDETNTSISSSGGREKEEEATLIDSSQPSGNNIKFIEGNEVTKDVKHNSIEINEDLLKDNIKSQMKTLLEGVKNEATFEHIIATILDIYTEDKSWIEVLRQIKNDFNGIDANADAFESLCSLAISLSGYNRGKSDIYVEEVPQDKEELGRILSGKVYDYIYDFYDIK